MKNIKLLLMVFTFVALVFACKDKVDPPANNNNNNTGKTKSELLTENRWKVSALLSSSLDIWATSLVQSCNKDNEYKFRKDDSLAVFDMASKCSPSDPDSTVSFYKLYNNNTQLILNVQLASSIVINDTADIIELSASSMKLNAEYSGLPATIIFSHP